MSYDNYTKRRLALALCFIVPLLFLLGVSAFGRRLASGAYSGYGSSWSGLRSGMSRLAGALLPGKANEERARKEEMLGDLLEKERSFGELADENRRLRSMLGLKAPAGWKCIHAELSRRDPAVWNMEFWIDRGAEDGVAPGNPVLIDGVLAGRVSEVLGQSSRVNTVASPLCRFSAFIRSSEGTVHPCVCSGAGDGLSPSGAICSVDFISKDARLAEGDYVVTSGLGTEIPYGIPVGTMVPDSEGNCPTIVDSARAMGFVRPMADLRKLSFVTVYVK